MRSRTAMTKARENLTVAAADWAQGRRRTPQLLFTAAREMVRAEKEHAAYQAWRAENPDACPCQGPEDDPGPTHIKACPFSDPEYEPPRVVMRDPEHLA